MSAALLIFLRFVRPSPSSLHEKERAYTQRGTMTMPWFLLAALLFTTLAGRRERMVSGAEKVSIKVSIHHEMDCTTTPGWKEYHHLFTFSSSCPPTRRSKVELAAWRAAPVPPIVLSSD